MAIVYIYMVINLVAWAIYMMIAPRILKFEGWWKVFISATSKNPLRWAYSIIAIALCGWYLVAESIRGVYELKKLKEHGFDLEI